MKLNNLLKNKYILYILLILSIVSLIFSSIQIFTYFKDNYENTIIFNNIKRNIKEENNNISQNNNKYNINFENFKKQNEDTVGYLKVNGTDIETLVVKSRDNNYYLTHNFKREKNKSGWIFMDYRNKLDGNDKNIIIYGHNMRNGSMFASLKNTLDNSWLENKENQSIIFETENKHTIYQVFSVYKIKKEDYYLTTDFKDDDYKNFISTLKKRSIYNFDVDLNDTDNILTLSTCANNSNYRIVLHAKKTIENNNF